MASSSVPVVASAATGSFSHALVEPPTPPAPATGAVSASATSATPEEQTLALKQEELELARQVARDFPTNAAALILVGNTYRGQGQAKLAVPWWEKALALDPRRADVWEGLGQIAYDQGDFTTAAKHWRKLLELTPAAPQIRGKIAEAIMNQGKYAEAAELLTEEIAQSPRSDLDQYLLGQAHLRLQHWDLARACYEKAIELNPRNANAYYGLIHVFSRLKQPDAARKYLAQVKRLKAEEIAAVKQKNLAYVDLAAVRRRLAELCVAAAALYSPAGKTTEVIRLLRRAMALRPDDLTAQKQLAALYQQRQQFAEARSLLEQIRQQEPDDTFSLLNLGLILSQQHKLAEAEKVFARVIEVAPDQSAGYRELAQLHLRAGRSFPQALQLAEQAVAREPVARNYFVLSWARDKNGQTAAALAAMKRALELDPNNPQYQQMYSKLVNRK